LGKLRPYTNYTLYVIAYNMHGGSDPSRNVTVTTGEDGKWTCFSSHRTPPPSSSQVFTGCGVLIVEYFKTV